MRGTDDAWSSSAGRQRAEPVVTPAALARRTLDGLWEETWRYCPPNRQVYPWQWLWDSCFHAVCWAALGSDRAAAELSTLFGSLQRDGFLPHMTYHSRPSEAVGLWGRERISTITQPPMHGHAIRVLAERGFDVSSLIDKAEAAFGFLFEQRTREGGLIAIVHPWESGSDDSPRWQAWWGGFAEASSEVPFDRRRWMDTKLALVDHLELNETGSAVANPSFEVAAASFNALVAFNALELSYAGGPSWLRQAGEDLARAIDDMLFDEGASTWADLDLHTGSRALQGTLDGLLPLLVTPDIDRAAALLDAFCPGGPFFTPYGPCGQSRLEGGFDPASYGSGSVWPHLTYLFVLAARRAGRTELAEEMRMAATRAMLSSGFAEHLDASTGEGLGARPQGWAALPVAL